MSIGKDEYIIICDSFRRFLTSFGMTGDWLMIGKKWRFASEIMNLKRYSCKSPFLPYISYINLSFRALARNLILLLYIPDTHINNYQENNLSE